MARRAIPNKSELELVMKELERGSVKPFDVALYLVLMSFANPKGKSCFPGQATLAALMGGLSIDTIQRALLRLGEANIVRIRRDKYTGASRNDYLLVPRAKTYKPHEIENGLDS